MRYPSTDLLAVINPVLGELFLNAVPGPALDDRPVQTLIGQPLVDHHAEIDSILQDEVQIAARDWTAADGPPALRDAPVRADISPIEVLCKRVDRSRVQGNA